MVGRLDAAGTVDTTTLLTSAFPLGAIRAAATVDGSSFWVGGVGNSLSPGGVWYVPFGTSNGTAILANPGNVRAINLFGGQLYGSAAVSGYYGVFTIGAKVPPQAGGATAQVLTGMPASGINPCAFVLLDPSPGGGSFGTLYMMDYSAGVQRWTYSSSSWTRDAGFAAPGSGCHGLTSDGAVLIASTATIISRIDITSSGAATPTTLRRAATNTFYRGVALAPH